MWALRVGLASPPYTRRNAIIIETTGHRSGKRRRVPVGFLKQDGKPIVVAEATLAASWVRKSLAPVADLGDVTNSWLGSRSVAAMAWIPLVSFLQTARVDSVHES